MLRPTQDLQLWLSQPLHAHLGCPITILFLGKLNLEALIQVCGLGAEERYSK